MMHTTQEITDADREAASLLREILADLSGFWHNTGDDSPLCQALARHRALTEQQMLGKIAPLMTASAMNPSPAGRPSAAGRLTAAGRLREQRDSAFSGFDIETGASHRALIGPIAS